jgi:hypothetical protein
MEVSSAGGAPQGAAGVEVADAGSRLGDSVVGLLLHLVVRGTGAGVARSAAPGDEAPPPRSSSIVRGIWLCLPGSPGSLPPSIN